MCKTFDFEENKDDVLDFEDHLSYMNLIDRVRTIVNHFGADSVTLLTSFGVQSGVMLALVAEACPELRVLYIDTQGPTSERDLEYGRQVLDVLGLKNFTVAKSDVTREEFRKGMEWVGITPEGKTDGHNVFHLLSQDVFKVTPLKQECLASGVKCLLSGVRRGQTSERNGFKFLKFSHGDDPSKGHPILDLSDEECLEFLRLKNIPPHPELSPLVDAIQSQEDGQGSNAKQGEAYSQEKEQKRHYLENSKSNSQERSSLLRSVRSERREGMECGIHIQEERKTSNKDPIPSVPNVVVGKINCRFCIAAKELLKDQGVNFVETPLHLFMHLVPAGTNTVPVIYLDKTLIGGYGDLCEHLQVEDTLNTK